MLNPYSDTADRCWLEVVRVSRFDILSVCCSVLLVMQSEGKHGRPVAVEMADIGADLVGKVI